MSDSQDTTTQEISQGFCQCGCGQKTNLATITVNRLGRKKGQPMNYIAGHHLRGKSGERNHGWKGGTTIPEHIRIAEKALGKKIEFPHVVHHQTPEQLVICEDQGYHLLLHKRQRAYDACGNAHWLKCKYCKQYDPPEKITDHYHQDCKNAHQRKHHQIKQSMV